MKTRAVYVCQNCGHQEPKWLGKCPSCGAWNALVEEVTTVNKSGRAVAATRKDVATPINQVVGDYETRVPIGIQELDRVLGGGLVHGALILVGGDPGIGKSTLLLQALGELARQKKRVLYVSAEESQHQVKLRAERLGIRADSLYLLATTELENVLAACKDVKPAVMVVDSIQTVGLAELESATGSVAQIRGVTHKLMHLAKGDGITTFVVGHVTKDGTIAGPKVMEHMVDTVLYFEGERTGPYRVLRAHKNRFGSSQEIGVFEMVAGGLQPVSNPSELFLSQRAEGPGAVVVSSLEGSRPILLEVQALTSPSFLGTPRRTTIGMDSQRVSMLCAVLDRHVGTQLSASDVYVNVAGGVRASEPALDLGVVLALVSASRGVALPSDTVVVGEVGLSGEIRAVAQLAARVAEAAQLGFRRCLVPQIDVKRWRGEPAELPLDGVASLREALDAMGLLSQ